MANNESFGGQTVSIPPSLAWLLAYQETQWVWQVIKNAKPRSSPRELSEKEIQEHLGDGLDSVSINVILGPLEPEMAIAASVVKVLSELPSGIRRKILSDYAFDDSLTDREIFIAILD